MDSLILSLTAANEAYRNGKAILMTDEEYDIGLEQLSKKMPNHPLLTTLRAPPTSGKTVPMPFYLGSLDKAKIPEDLAKWLNKHTNCGFQISEKLDGISGLWCPQKSRLYLSGDDNTGLDVSAWLKYISLGKTAVDISDISENVWIRGELILPRSQIPEGRLGRSIANGIFHHDIPDPAEAAKVRFVGYEIIGMASTLSVTQQFAWLDSWNCWTPWNWSIKELPSADHLSQTLAERRLTSEYDMDGLVIRTNKPQSRVNKGNPKDAIAWKPPTGDTKLTKVIAVEWNASANGRLIPRVQIEPVSLGGSTINFVTGTHARRIVDWSIGPGATVVIRKGGDVIPVLDRVEVPAAVLMPPEGTWIWETDINIRQKTEDATTIAAQLLKMVTKLDWEGVGPSQIDSLVKAGYTSVPTLRLAKTEDLKKLLGPTKGQKFYDLIQSTGWKGASEIDLYIASPICKTGFGKTRLETLLTLEPDVTKWLTATTMVAPKGWSPDALQEFLKSWRAYEEFRKKDWSFLEYPVKPVTQLVSKLTTEVPKKGSVVFSGIRALDLEAKLAAKGYMTAETVKSDCKAVFIADTKAVDTYSSTKTEKAKKIPGCLILRCAEWERL